MKLLFEKSDIFGAISSTLCIVHCLATPFIFIAHTCSINGCNTGPFWWNSLDYMFLTLSFFAVLSSAKNTSSKYMKRLLWLNWFVFFMLIINEGIQFISLPETATYLVGISLAILHIYNLKYCQCKNNKCCKSSG